MKLKLSLIIALVLFAFFANAQVTKQATARIFEAQSKALSRIVIVYETGESEVIPLENLKFLGNIDDVLINNQKTINTFLNKMAEKGYEISKMTSSGEAYIYTFIVFTKKE